MARTLLSLAGIAAAGVIVSGCATTTDQCDPSNANIFTSAGALGSGCYQERIDDRRASLDALNYEGAMLRDELRSALAELDDVQARQAAAETSIGKLADSNRSLRSDILKLQGKKDLTQAELQEARQRLDEQEAAILALEQEIKNAGVSAEALEAEKEKMQAVRGLLSLMQDQVAGPADPPGY